MSHQDKVAEDQASVSKISQCRSSSSLAYLHASPPLQNNHRSGGSVSISSGTQGPVSYRTKASSAYDYHTNQGFGPEAYLDGSQQRFRWLARDEETSVSGEKTSNVSDRPCYPSDGNGYTTVGNYGTQSTVNSGEESHEQVSMAHHSHDGQAHGSSHHEATRLKPSKGYREDIDKTASDEERKRVQEQDVTHMGRWVDDVSGVEWEE